jgi:cytochrome c-type biogenesis protein CcmE
MRKRSQRLWLIGAAVVLVGGAIALASVALKDTVAFFYSPSDLVEKNVVADGKSARVGGLVEAGSETHDSTGALLFHITDNKNSVPVVFDGIPPDLFKEGQGVIAEGRFDGEGRLIATRVLAKHDENYMPKEVHDALCKKSPESCQGDGGAYVKEPVS